MTSRQYTQAELDRLYNAKTDVESADESVAAFDPYDEGNYYDPSSKLTRNLCSVCKIDMGPRGFTRQYCRKTWCPEEK